MKPPRTHTVYSDNEVVEVRELTYDWDMLRKFRDDLLEQTDWRAVKDRTMSQAWKDYRQALRDLPQDYENANDAADNWPVMPDA